MIKQQTIAILFIFFIGTTFSGYSQNLTAHRKPLSERSVPKIIINTFSKQYPNVLLRGWFSTHLIYWENDYSSDWYNGWYGKRTVVVYTYQKPNYYEVEFIDNPGELSRAIYNLYGNWYETRTKIKGLTMGILEALKASKYNGWKISTTMEKLESPMWPIEIYRFQVSKGIKSQTIRMDKEGSIIQVKELNE